MTRAARSERTVRLLTLRLEELASALERSAAAGGATHLLELASVATSHAVSLELITRERAVSVWAAAAERHPVLARFETGETYLPERAA